MKATIPVDIETLVKQLPLRDKLLLVRRLEQETWAAQLDDVVTRIRSRRSVQELSWKEITSIVEDTRRARYARSSRRS